MSAKLHIVQVVADEARRQFFHRGLGRADLPKPRIRADEIGVQFVDGEFVPYADLGYSTDAGLFRLSEMVDLPNEAVPYAASGRLIDLGQIIITTGASRRLTNDEIGGLLERHASGDYGEYGEFYELDVNDDMLCGDPIRLPSPGPANKVNTLTGLDAIISVYTLQEHRFWVITEAGDNRTTVILLAGPSRD